MIPTDYEIRALRENETDAMVALMCLCFGLDLRSATRIFHADPFFDINLKRVLVDRASGQILSCLTLIPCRMRLTPGDGPQSTLTIGGIAGVCTLPELRGRGLAALLLDRSSRDASADLGFAATALTAERPAYYVARGWAPCGAALEWCAPAAFFAELPGAESKHRCVQLVTEGEIIRSAEKIHALYQSAVSDRTRGAILRSAQRWRSIETLSVGRRVLVATDEAGVLTGYAAYELRMTEVGQTALVHECIAPSKPARRALLSFFAANAVADYVAGRGSEPEVSALGLIGHPDIKVTPTPGMYIRVGDFAAVLQTLAGGKSDHPRTHGFEGTIRFCETDPQGRARSEFGIVLRDGAAKTAMALRASDALISGSTSALSLLVLGSQRASVLHAAGEITVRGESSMLAALDAAIPPLSPFLGIPDLF